MTEVLLVRYFLDLLGVMFLGSGSKWFSELEIWCRWEALGDFKEM